MKKLYFSFMLVLLAIPTVFAQNPNNHWQLGVSDVNFTTNPPTVSTIANNGQYGKASISDNNGNLLFYTDGQKVWNKNHVIIPDGNPFAYPYVLGVVIVPNPANSSQYYIFRSIVESSLGSSLSSFYTYSIVEFNVSNPLGILLNINNNPEIPLVTNYSLRLNDALNNQISNQFYFNPLTVAKNFNNDGYWIIIQNQNKILSYRLDSLGFNNIPVESTFTNSQTNDYGVNLASIGTDIKGKSYSDFKISPSNAKLGGLTFASRGGTQVFGGPPTSSFYTIDFDSSTGQLSNHVFVYSETNITTGFIINNFEFSNNSDNVYLVRFPSRLTNISTPLGEIIVKNLSNISNPIRIINQFNNSTTFPSFFNYLQRDKYGNIIVSSTYSNLSRNLFLHKIDNQDTFLSSSVVVNSIFLNNNPISVLPQIIPLISPPCPSALVITTNITTGVDKKQALNAIEASNVINSSAGAIYHGGTSVTLKLGFNAKTGSAFRAYQAGCTGTFIARPSIVSSQSNQESVKLENTKVKEVIKIAPNPNNGIFTLSLDGISNGFIEISDLYGVTIYKSEFKNQTEFELDMQVQRKGIYIAKVVSDNQTYTAKIIKE